MPWINDIDPTTPSDVDPASQGDDQLRTLKAAIEERLVTKFPGWPDTEPLRILGVTVGSLANRPATPAGDGEVYIVDDPLPKKLYYGKGGAWVEFTFQTTIASFFQKNEGSVVNESIPVSASHLFSMPLTIAATKEVVAWRYRWRWPSLSADWLPWAVADSHLSHGVPEGPGDYSGLVQLTRFEIDRLAGTVNFYFKNTDSGAHLVDIQWAVTLLDLG